MRQVAVAALVRFVELPLEQLQLVTHGRLRGAHRRQLLLQLADPPLVPHPLVGISRPLLVDVNHKDWKLELETMNRKRFD